VAAAIDLAVRLAKSGFNERLAARVASHLPDGQNGGGVPEAGGEAAQ
jgi:hypothetical protein